MAFKETLTPILGPDAEVPKSETSVQFMNMKFKEVHDNTLDNRQQISISSGSENDGISFGIKNPYKNGGALSLKGQMHCHTTNSDGADTPYNLVNAYKLNGYDFMTITDHNVITPNPNVDGITWIGESVEESYLRHVVAYDVTAYSGLKSSQEVMTYHKEKGKMTSLAHPHWMNQYVLDEFEMKSYYDHNFIEVYNDTVRGYAEQQWDWALSANRVVFATAVDDCHSANGETFNKGWVVVKTNANTKDAILQSLREGNFYASTGNDINISVANNIVTATSTATSNFTFVGRDGKILKTENNVLTSNYTIKGYELYVRVKSELSSDITKKAFAQPIFINTIREQKQYADIYKNLQLSGVNRQALINGGFNVWQRGESLDLGSLTANAKLADGWNHTQSQGSLSATLPTLVVSKLPLALDYVPLVSNAIRFSYNSVGVANGDDHYSIFNQYIEEGVKLLGSMSKKITLSFYARSSIPNKKIAIEFRLNFGTGGSPSSQIDVQGGVVELTPYFKRYSVTVTLPDLINFTFGTNNDSYIRATIWNYWGSAYNTRLGATSAEFPTTTGVLDFTGMVLNSTDFKLPYMPKTYAEDLRDCQRYYTKSSEDIGVSIYATAMTTGALICNYVYPCQMQKAPTITVSQGGVTNRIRKTMDGTIINATSIAPVGNKNMLSYISVAGATLVIGEIYEFKLEASAEY